ncbi:MAG: hypothetical protein ACQEP3_01300 [Patescibacteria group bacterium]
MKNILKKVAFISFLLALVAGTIAFVYFERGDFSEADLRVEIIGPEEVEVGEEVEYSIRYRNNSDIRLEDVSVTFEYPEASVPVKEDEDEVVEEKETFRRVRDLENIDPGEEEVINFKAKIFGEKSDKVEAKAWFDYTPQNLSAEYEVERTHTGVITDVPINFEFDLPGQVEGGEEFAFRARYFSQLDSDLENIGVKMKYPSDFEFLRSTPSGLEDNEWERDLLESNEGALIEVFGKLDGDPGDIKGFKAELGVWKFDRFIPLKKIEQEVSIPQPNLFVDIVVNDSSEYIADPGEDLLYDVYLKNIGDETLEDLFLTADLDQEVLDMSKTEPMGARFQREAGSIIWSHSSFSELRSLRPEDEEKISFWTSVKEEDLPYNPEAVVSMDLGQMEEESRVKINTELDLKQDFLIEEKDDFESEGPLPLRSNRPSTYTVSWEARTRYNNLEDVEITSKLPEGAGIVEEEYEDGTEFEFDSQTREITWSLEEVEEGAGFSRNTPKATFQVENIPMSSVEEDTTLVGETKMVATDSWTEETLEKKVDALVHKDLLDKHGLDAEDSVRDLEFEEDEE